MHIVSIRDLKEKLEGKQAAEAGVVFEYLEQRGRVNIEGEEYIFPLWPPQEMPPVKVLHRWMAEDFWRVVNAHWNHQCFLEEGNRDRGTYVGFICVKCGVRIEIEAHAYVSVNLPPLMEERVGRIKSVQEVFEWNRLRMLGLHLGSPSDDEIGDLDLGIDPILDDWPFPIGDGSNHG